jgi:hypothetical protein
MPPFDPNDYIDVNDRILRFWSEYPEGRIETNLMSPPDDFTQCRFRASVYKSITDAAPAATGWAFELAGGGGANRTSHEENCETSAIGRALANLGYATSAKERPSRQEMRKAAGAGRAAAETVALITPEQVRQLWILARQVWPKRPEHGDVDAADVTVHDEIRRKWGRESTKDLTAEEARIYIARLRDLASSASTAQKGAQE